MAACSVYGPKRRDDKALSTRVSPSSICSRFQKEFDQEPPQPNRFGGKILPKDRVARRGRVTFIENEIKDVQHRVEPVGKFGSRRDLVRDLRVADFPLGANDALRQGWRGNQESARDLLGLQAASFSQREGDACVGREGRVAASKDEPEPVVLQATVAEVRSERRAGLQLFGGCGERRIESRASPEPIYCLEAAGGDKPGARILRHAVARPG